MKYLIIITSLVIAFGCGNEDIVTEKETEKETEELQTVTFYDAQAACGEEWVCWNTESHLHGKTCTDECFEPGNKSKYCYLVSDCQK